MYIFYQSLQVLQLQNQALAQENQELWVLFAPLPSSDSAFSQAGAKMPNKGTNSLEGLLMPTEIKNCPNHSWAKIKDKAEAYPITIGFIWWGLEREITMEDKGTRLSSPINPDGEYVSWLELAPNRSKLPSCTTSSLYWKGNSNQESPVWPSFTAIGVSNQN